MAVHANITRRAAVLGALASTAALAVPAVATVKRMRTEDGLDGLSDAALVFAVAKIFDESSFERQLKFISDLRSEGGLLAEMGDVFEQRRQRQWVWVPANIPGLLKPSHT